MASRVQWMFLVYRLPREPSTPLVGASSGGWEPSSWSLASSPLPADPRNREHLERLADEVLEADGEALL